MSKLLSLEVPRLRTLSERKFKQDNLAGKGLTLSSLNLPLSSSSTTTRELLSLVVDEDDSKP